MLTDVDWAEDGTYRPDEYNSPEKFFNDSLENSTEFDLQLGYFSSAAISVLADGFATFISNGGKMRLVINHIVSNEDKDAINKGLNGGVVDCFDLSDFEKLRSTFDEYQQQFFECLAYLIHNKRIDIRIIKPKNKQGIAHTKSGQFRDGDTIISFTGSANFTISGLFNNLEEIKIDRGDSVDNMIKKRIESQRAEFDSIMFNKKENVEYLSADSLVVAIRSNYGDKDIEELLDVEKKLRKIKKEKLIRERQQYIDIVCDDECIKPRFPYSSGPREYQKQAFENWKNNCQKGLFAMATGTGKTITSLNCLLEIYNRLGYYKAIILVPTITLVEQWEIECKKFNFSTIIKVCSKYNNWRSSVANICLLEMTDSENTLSYIIISTYASFVRSNVFGDLNQFPKNKLLFIADEAHNMSGGLMLQRLLDIKYLRRIGLSATPERQYNEVSNTRLMEFFGCGENYTFEYSMAEAIENGALCKYYYYPHVVRLTDNEMQGYIELSKRIVKIINFKDKETQETLKMLLLKRKRIIHKAANKLPIFKQIIEQRMKDNGNLKYTLIYVPEGNKPDTYEADIFDQTDSIDSDPETEHLIDNFTRIVRDSDPHVIVRQFTADSADRDTMLKGFANGSIDVLTSMKCFDEGVDVPRSEFAVFCASTGNPRQFIQRRGRVLRTHKDKQFAVIHDLIVIPDKVFDEECYNLEKNLVASELKRVRDFALLSENLNDTDNELQDVLNHYNLSIFN